MMDSMLLIGALGGALVMIAVQHANLQIWKKRALGAEERSERLRVQRNRMPEELWKVIKQRLMRAEGEAPTWVHDPDWWKRQ